MADSQWILELSFLHRRGGGPFTALLLYLKLVGTYRFMLSASLGVVLVQRTELHIGIKIHKQHSFF